MIKKFKMFENYGSRTKNDILKEFEYDYIDEYFMENYNIDVEEIISIWPQIIENHIDDKGFVENFIDNEINNSGIEDFSDSEYKEYIENNIDSDMELEIINFYKENEGLDENIISGIDGRVNIITSNEGDITTIKITNDKNEVEEYEITNDYTISVKNNQTIQKNTIIAKNDDLEYDSYMLDSLDEDQLRDVITNCDKEEEFIEETINNRYDDYDAMEIIKEFYGNISGKQLYDIVGWYLDEDALINDYKENESQEYKEDFIMEELERDEDLYDYLIEKDENNILLIVDYFIEENSTPTITSGYEFQKSYIEKTVENYFDDSEYDEEEQGEIIASALKKLNDNFVLDSDIKYEYEDYMYKINAEKYNI